VSGENVKTVLSVFQAFGDRDGAMFAAYAPDIEWDLREFSQWIYQPLFRGHDGIREFFRLWLAEFEEYEAEAQNPVDAGERVVVTIVERGRGKRSGVPTAREHGQIWTLRDGLVVRVQQFDSRAAALKAVGLEE
jgi:ketosteroid isomerase-like protein